LWYIWWEGFTDNLRFIWVIFIWVLACHLIIGPILDAILGTPSSNAISFVIQGGLGIVAGYVLIIFIRKDEYKKAFNDRKEKND